MEPGALRHRVALQSGTLAGDGGGGRTLTWTDIGAEFWAAVEPLQGVERLRAMQIRPTLSHRIWMRYQAGVTSTMRVRYGTRTFEIMSVIDTDERHRELVLLCEER